MTKKKATTKEPTIGGGFDQAVSKLQLDQLQVRWELRTDVIPNSYNPNRMDSAQRSLLKRSVLEDGWTQPIVVQPFRTDVEGPQGQTLSGFVIIDGEQRWTTAGMTITPEEIQEIIDEMTRMRDEHGQEISQSILDRLALSKSQLIKAMEAGAKPTIASITGGRVPVTVLDLKDDAHRFISTIRHNRAKGSHDVSIQAQLVQDLAKMGVDMDSLQTRLAMDSEEVGRLLQTAESALSLLDDGAVFSQAQEIQHMAERIEGPIKDQINMEATKDASDKFQEYEQKKQKHNRDIDERTEELTQARLEKTGGKVINQDELGRIRAKAKSELRDEAPAKPNTTVMKKITFFVTNPEAEIIYRVLGESSGQRLFEICKGLDTE